MYSLNKYDKLSQRLVEKDIKYNKYLLKNNNNLLKQYGSASLSRSRPTANNDALTSDAGNNFWEIDFAGRRLNVFKEELLQNIDKRLGKFKILLDNNHIIYVQNYGDIIYNLLSINNNFKDDGELTDIKRNKFLNYLKKIKEKYKTNESILSHYRYNENNWEQNKLQPNNNLNKNYEYNNSIKQLGFSEKTWKGLNKNMRKIYSKSSPI